MPIIHFAVSIFMMEFSINQGAANGDRQQPESQSDPLIRAEAALREANTETLEREGFCFIGSPLKCLVVSFGRLSVLPELVLNVLDLPKYFKFDTNKLANGH